MKKIIPVILRTVITVLIWSAGGYLLFNFEYFTAIKDIDNIIGMLPVGLVIAGAGSVTALTWMKYKRSYLPVTVSLAVFAALSVLLFPTALKGNWWLNITIQEGAEAKPDLTVFAPFSENSQTAKLNEEASLTLADHLPTLDGATALYPVYAAFAETVYDRASFSSDDVLCTNTSNAYEAVISGGRDIIFVAGASEKQKAKAKLSGADLKFTPIGREAFVFLTGTNNPVNSITYQQIRNIYSGKTAYWGTLGWKDGGKIIAFQRPEGSGSQTGLQNLMGNLPILSPQPLPDDSLIGTNSLMKQVSVKWRGVQPALGYSYRYYAAVMFANPNAKMLSIDGVKPSIENIRNGSYPFTANFYAVTNGEPSGNSKRLIDWILSQQGQDIIEKTGYTPINND